MTLTPPAPPAAPPSFRSPAGTDLRASAGRRTGAYLVDVAIVAVVALTVWLLTGSVPLVVVAVLELWAIGWIWEGHTGATPGNLVCGIRTVQRESLLSVGALRLLARSALMGLAHVIPVLLPVGLAASGALDAVAGARVIDVRKARRAGALSGGSSLEPLVTAVPAGSPTGSAEQSVITRTPLTAAPLAAPSSAPPRAADPALPPPSGAATVPVLELADGTTIRVSGPGFIGRAPRAPEAIPDAILVRVPDGARSLSRTHASFGIEEGQLWVQDLGSANGASVRHLGGSTTDLAPRTPFFLVPGDVLVLGGDAELVFRRVVDRVPTPQPDPQPSAPAPRPSAPPAPRVAAAASPPADAAVSVIALQFQDGTTVPIRGTGYIGRAPSLPDGERADAALVAVPDGDRSVSRTHGRFGIVDSQAWFEDLGSGNGSQLRTADGRSGPMTPHQRFGLVPGMTLQLGDCVIRVVRG